VKYSELSVEVSQKKQEEKGGELQIFLNNREAFKHTVKNLKVLKVIPEENLIVIKGCVPGDTDSIVILNK
jgi:hypothetical protein